MALAIALNHIADLSVVLSYKNHELTRRLLRKNRISSDQALELFDDLKKFLYIASLTGKPLRPTLAIDEAWHEFILFTRDYQEFCSECFGKFLHHQPDTGDQIANATVRETISIAKSVFGDELSGNWISGAADCTPDTNCESPPSDCALIS